MQGPAERQDRSLQNHNALLLLFHQNLDHGFSYVVTAFAFAAGLVQLAGEEDGKPSAAQNAADVLGTGLEAAVGGFVERASSLPSDAQPQCSLPVRSICRSA